MAGHICAFSSPLISTSTCNTIPPVLRSMPPERIWAYGTGLTEELRKRSFACAFYSLNNPISQYISSLDSTQLEPCWRAEGVHAQAGSTARAAGRKAKDVRRAAHRAHGGVFFGNVGETGEETRCDKILPSRRGLNFVYWAPRFLNSLPYPDKRYASIMCTTLHRDTPLLSDVCPEPPNLSHLPILSLFPLPTMVDAVANTLPMSHAPSNGTRIPI
ncbi:uncharacterized protein VTP21DRAFT_1868 [Calcarisporiella thermophila]|uniref:uncharacterized protein n=1 Tax=Calcarisporiella thermophila TaxID=911321 RepID=UPI003743E5CA